ncbi:MAG: hypothetical protein QOC81_4229 [Thermoanaerobaculia bacterium]|jgi:hypothetical protein|nr:hypothetical protein [Thermoanaerobaculia bacterium]
MTDDPSDDLEFTAMRSVYSALKELDSEAQNRVLDYVLQRLGVKRSQNEERFPPATERIASRLAAAERQADPDETVTGRGDESRSSDAAEGDLEGISPVAVRWMKRNSLMSSQLSSLFSLGVDEIDLVAKAVPGKSIRERLHSVVLLTGVASYLSSGAARMTDDKVREASRHYDAYDGANFATTLKSLGSEVTGTKEAGYTLTARGLTAATELVRQIITAK